MRGVLLVLTMAAPVLAAEPPKQPARQAARVPIVLNAAPDVSGIRRATFNSIEKRIDKRLLSVPADNPCEILGGTRGLYVEGFGGVFTVELSLTVTPTVSPFRQQINQEDVQRTWIRKTKALPVLRETMKELLVSTADTLVMIPANESVVLAARLLYLSWEKTDLLPAQIVMRGERSALMRSGKNAIRVEEF